MEYEKQWEFLKHKFELGKLGHAYVFSGQDIEAIKLFAKEFLQYINCQDEKKPCAKCQQCLMIQKGNFPDAIVIDSGHSKSSLENERDMMEITIEQIREAQNFLSHTSYYGGYKSVIIWDADRLTTEAQNCFLKNLEEPKGKTLIILISTKAQMLLPTITSRCQEIRFISYGGNLSAQELAGMQGLLKVVSGSLAEKFAFAKQADVTAENFKKILQVLQKYFRNALLEVVAGIQNSEFGIKNKELGNKMYSVEKLKHILRLIEKLDYQASMSNASPKLALEVLLLEI